MSRIIHSGGGDISYSSINAQQFKDGRNDSCLQTCFLNFPYATITSTFLVISGMIITVISILQLGSVFDRFTQDLFHKRYLWLNELQVILFFIVIGISIIILTNLIIGFATSSSKFDGKPTDRRGGHCFCSRHSATNCLIRFVFFLNQIIFFIVLVLLVILCLVLFTSYILTTLCTADVPPPAPDTALNGAEKAFDPAYTNNAINLQPFADVLFFNGNETSLLVLKDHRLNTLCRDYVSTMTFYTLITLLGVSLLLIGFHCYLINLTVNRIRISTYKKYTELLYLNGTEMNTFNDASYDNGERF